MVSRQFVPDLPKVILLDTANGKHSADFCSRTDQFASDVSADLNHLILIVRELRWSGIGVELDVTRNELAQR